MSLRRLEVLQWLGLIAGGVIWAAQHVAGVGITEAVCDPGGRPWGISHDVWQASLIITTSPARSLLLSTESTS